jgi:UDP:flavonoid glycosyltransferase YjiC (YdhE family)
MLWSKLARWWRRDTEKRKRVLLAWELGGGTGHLHQLAAIGVALEARGYQTAFALRRLEHGQVISQALPSAEILPAPLYDPGVSSGNDWPAYDYADVLLRCGYGKADDLRPLVEQWTDLLFRVEPDVVICDHSPTVILAAARRIPVLHLGSGFATPPVGKSLAVLYGGSVRGAKERQAQVLASIQEIQRGTGMPVIQRVCDLLGLADRNLTCCLPELDPYRAVRPHPALGPIQKLPAPAHVRDSERVFGYLDGREPSTPRLLDSLARASVRCGIYVREMPPDLSPRFTGTSVTLYSAPQKMPDALESAAAIVHYGGLSTTETALALGRPQFLVPWHLEQALNTAAVEALNCGVNIAQHGNPGDLIRRALKRETHQKEAAAVAARIAARPAKDVLGSIVEAAAELLGRDATNVAAAASK